MRGHSTLIRAASEHQRATPSLCCVGATWWLVGWVRMSHGDLNADYIRSRCQSDATVEDASSPRLAQHQIGHWASRSAQLSRGTCM